MVVDFSFTSTINIVLEEAELLAIPPPLYIQNMECWLLQNEPLRLAICNDNIFEIEDPIPINENDATIKNYLQYVQDELHISLVVSSECEGNYMIDASID